MKYMHDAGWILYAIEDKFQCGCNRLKCLIRISWVLRSDLSLLYLITFCRKTRRASRQCMYQYEQERGRYLPAIAVPTAAAARLATATGPVKPMTAAPRAPNAPAPTPTAAAVPASIEMQ